jgi:hypothetical protein
MRFGGSLEGQGLGVEIRNAHVHRYQAGVVDARADQSGRAVEQHLAVLHVAALKQERRNASHAVATLLHFAAIAVEDAVVGMRAIAAGRLDDHGLVETDALVTIRKRAPLLNRGQAAVLRRVEHDHVVARAMHFGELELHAGRIPHRPACIRLCV